MKTEHNWWKVNNILALVLLGSVILSSGVLLWHYSMVSKPIWNKTAGTYSWQNGVWLPGKITGYNTSRDWPKPGFAIALGAVGLGATTVGIVLLTTTKKKSQANAKPVVTTFST
jgi:hypothetical protein